MNSTSRTDHFFYESGADPGRFLKGVRFDLISVLTLRIRTDMPEQTV